jgi:hypothetical protein
MPGPERSYPGRGPGAWHAGITKPGKLVSAPIRL